MMLGNKPADLITWQDYPYITTLVIPGFVTRTDRVALEASLTGKVEHLVAAVDQYWSVHIAQMHTWAERKQR